MNIKKLMVRLRGRGFLIAVEGKGSLKHGFYTNRFVEAEDNFDAANVAIAQIQNRSSLRDRVLNPPNDPPQIFVDGIVEMPPTEDISKQDQGLIWFLEQDSD